MASTKEKTSAAKLYTIQEDDLPTKKTEANISSNVFTNETSRKQACNMQRFAFDCMMYLITLMLMPTWLLAVFTTLLAGVATGTAANFSMCVTRQLVLF